MAIEPSFQHGHTQLYVERLSTFPQTYAFETIFGADLLLFCGQGTVQDIVYHETRQKRVIFPVTCSTMPAVCMCSDQRNGLCLFLAFFHTYKYPLFASQADKNLGALLLALCPGFFELQLSCFDSLGCYPRYATSPEYPTTMRRPSRVR